VLKKHHDGFERLHTRAEGAEGAMDGANVIYDAYAIYGAASVEAPPGRSRQEAGSWKANPSWLKQVAAGKERLPKTARKGQED